MIDGRGGMTSRALVLGGGGPVAGAWSVGVLAGLAEAGVAAAAEADLVIGTSIGAVLGAQLASGVPVAELYERQVSQPPELNVRVSLTTSARFLWAVLGTRNPVTAARRLGKLGMRAHTVPETEVSATLGALLGDVDDWPSRPLHVTAVDAHAGTRHVFDAGSGVPLRSALAAGGSIPGVWPLTTLDGRRWLDGGVLSTAHPDLARGHDRVLALAPLPTSYGPGPSAAQQAAELAADGTRVLLISPTRAARRAFGRNLLDTSRMPAAARAGREQAAAHVAEAASVWNA